MTEPEVQPVKELLQSGFRYALSLTRHQHQAEDILQDAWLAVLKANGSHTRPYLYAAIRTRFLNANKREQLVPFVSMDEAPEYQIQNQTPDLDDYVDHVLLDKSLGKLRSIEREALFLMVVEGYSAREVAEFTGQPRGTVLSLVHRAKSKLKDMLSQATVENQHEQ